MLIHRSPATNQALNPSLRGTLYVFKICQRGGLNPGSLPKTPLPLKNKYLPLRNSAKL